MTRSRSILPTPFNNARRWLLSPITSRRQVQCPYCFNKFKLKDGISGNRVVCTDKACGQELPASVSDYLDGLRPVIISVIGSKQAGKSNFIAVLIEWIKRTTDEFDWRIWGMNDDTLERYRDNFYKSVFSEKRVVEGSISALQGGGKTSRPLLFALSVRREGRRPQMMFLSFHDTAGEDLKNQNTMNKVNRYIAESQGILLLMDPLQLPKVRELLGNSIHLPVLETHVEDIVTRTANFIKSVKGIPLNDELTIPIAAVFTKVDALFPILPPDTALQHQSKHVGCFDQADFDDVNGEMRSLLRDWGAQAVIAQVEQHFPKHGYFGVSALGCNPGPTGAITEVKPIRILDPLAWQLSLHGILPKKQ